MSLLNKQSAQKLEKANRQKQKLDNENKAK